MKPGTTSPSPRTSALLAQAVQLMDQLFDHLPDTAFFVKDAAGRYLAVNRSLVERSGLARKSELIGRQVDAVFPPELAVRYAAQDDGVLRTGRPLIDHLELHWYARGRPGWCLTTKFPLRDVSGRIIGLVGISRDLRAPGDREHIPPGLTAALEHLDHHYAGPLTVASLARRAGLPLVRFERLIRRIFRLTPSQLISQTRLNAASRLLQETDRPVADIAYACGFYDHSAFSRAFRSATGLAPTQFRRTR